MKRKVDHPVSSVSRARTYEELGRYWDAHDLGPDLAGPQLEVAVDIRRRRFLVAIEPKLFAKVRKEASKQGLSAESLLNLWLQEKCASAR